MKFHDKIESVDILAILEETSHRMDFGGMEITSNYATCKYTKSFLDFLIYELSLTIFTNEDAKPTCWIDEEENLFGLFKDALDIASKNLNLSLSFKKTLPKNMDKWFIK